MTALILLLQFKQASCLELFVQENWRETRIDEKSYFYCNFGIGFFGRSQKLQSRRCEGGRAVAANVCKQEQDSWK